MNDQFAHLVAVLQKVSRIFSRPLLKMQSSSNLEAAPSAKPKRRVQFGVEEEEEEEEVPKLDHSRRTTASLNAEYRRKRQLAMASSGVARGRGGVGKVGAAPRRRKYTAR